ncbi:MAG TPA: antitoxin Xre/MbcA/ParS toxin-binding domain-containing protein [Myxococcales bacterium]|nr:antitoxin Xre/MbcA/ParS toxin-binding domain-containing protein [Myxococcales bacterium]
MKREPTLVPERKPPPEAVVAKALVRAAQRLGIAQAELAEVLGTSAASVSRTFSGERPVAPESAEGRHALLFLRLFRSLDTLVGGDEDKARCWLEAPNTHLGGQPPRALLASTPGLVRVAEYLDAMRGTL